MSTFERLAYEPMPSARLWGYMLGILLGGVAGALLLLLLS